MGIEPHLKAMLKLALEKETEIRQSMTPDKFGENGDPTEQVDGCAFWHISREDNAGRWCRTAVGRIGSVERSTPAS